MVEKAAEKDFADAMGNLAWAYGGGHGVERNKALAMFLSAFY